MEEPKGVFASLDVFDSAGSYVHRVEFLCDRDATEDALFFVGDHVYVVTDYYGAYMAYLGGQDSEPEGEVEPVSVIALRCDLPRVGLAGK